MAKEKTATWIFPSGGINRRYDYQGQPPFTTADALNVRPIGPVEGRQRGGSRPGLGKAFQEQLGDGKPVNLMADVITSPPQLARVWTDGFEGVALGTHWTYPLVGGESTRAPALSGPSGGSIPDGFVGLPSVKYEVSRTAFYLNHIPIDPDATHRFRIYISPYGAKHWGTYGIYCRLGNADGTAEPNFHFSGYLFFLATGFDEVNQGYMLANSTRVVEGEDITSNTVGIGSPTATGAQSGWFEVEITSPTSGPKRIESKWNGVATGVVETIANSVSGMQFGIFMQSGAEDGAIGAPGWMQIAAAQLFYSHVTSEQIEPDGTGRRLLIAGSDSKLYAENTSQVMEVIESSATYTTDPTLMSVSPDRPLQTTMFLRKLYIADWSEARSASTDNAGIVSTAVFTDSDVADWTTLGIVLGRDVIRLSDSGTSGANDVYGIANVAVASLTLDDSPGDDTDFDYQIMAGPKVYDPDTGAITLWKGDGGTKQVPLGCPLIAYHGGRLWLAGAAENPHIWYASRLHDPNDWDTFDVAGEGWDTRASSGDAAGSWTPASPITALVPHSDDYMIIACRTELWVVLGDPNAGGGGKRVSSEVGVVTATAWCHTPDMELVFLAPDGLYAIPSGYPSGPVSISAPKLPGGLKGVDPDVYYVVLSYDPKDRGIHIHLTPKASTGTRHHYWFDYETRSFWPATYQGRHHPITTASYPSPNEPSHVETTLLGCRDGYIRFHNDAQGDDDGTTFDSYVFIGPLRLGLHDDMDGIVRELVGVMGGESGDESTNDLSWSIYVGHTPEMAFKSDAAATGRWGRGINTRAYPRVRGHSAYLKIQGGGSEWAMAYVTAQLRRLGRHRLL